MLKTWLRLMVAAITIGALVACGGGGQEVSSLPTTQGASVPQWDFSKATQSETLLGGARKQALAVTSSATITVNELFDWAQKEYSFLFPSGPVEHTSPSIPIMWAVSSPGWGLMARATTSLRATSSRCALAPIA